MYMYVNQYPFINEKMSKRTLGQKMGEINVNIASNNKKKYRFSKHDKKTLANYMCVGVSRYRYITFVLKSLSQLGGQYGLSVLCCVSAVKVRSVV